MTFAQPNPQPDPFRRKPESNRRGILLAGGLNSRLYPATLAAPKSLLPVGDAPMIYRPLCALMAAGVRDILIITAPRWADAHRRLLGDGGGWGLRFQYAAQPRPLGIADAYRVGRKFVGGKSTALALCDNIFFGSGFESAARRAATQESGATVFLKQVPDPERFGVATLDAGGRIVSLAEKPRRPASDWAATGMYFFDGAATGIATGLRPSARGELEITDLLREYVRRGSLRAEDGLRAEKLGRGVAWFDAGTPESLIAAGRVALRRGKSPKTAGEGSPELSALRNGWIGRKEFRSVLGKLGDSPYARRVSAAAEKKIEKNAGFFFRGV